MTSPQRMALALTALAALTLPALTARAHELVDQGRRLLRRAQFEEALSVLDRAEASPELTRSDVVAIYDARALAHLALEDAAGLRRDLAVLAALDPSHRFGREAPPELPESLRRAVEASEGPLAVRAAARAQPGAVEVVARAVNDPPGLVREVRTMVRRNGEDFRRAGEGPEPVPTGETLEYYAEAIGPGGAVLASAGTADAPLVSEPALAAAASSLVRPGGDEEGGGGVSPWLWVGIAAGVLVAGGVVLAILLAGSGQSGTQPNPPIVIGF